MRAGQSFRWLGIGSLLAGAATFVLLTAGAGSAGGSHTLWVTVPNATGVLAGQQIRAAGVVSGSVDSVAAVDHGHAARLQLTIDNTIWPLQRGTTMDVRWGGTVSYVNRYINLVRGPNGAPAMALSGVFPAANFKVPQEFDSFLNTFTGPVRANLKTFLRDAGGTFNAAEPNLVRALDNAPPALTQVSDVLTDLDSNQTALNELVRDGGSVVAGVNAADPNLQSLITNAATTFGAFASRTQQLNTVLARAPGMFAQTRTTLAKAQPTLALAEKVTGRIAPGVVQVDDDAAPLDGLLVTLHQVGPDAVSALASAHQATPALNPLLSKATKLMPTLQSIGSQSTHELECIRPYTPDIVAFTSDWGDFLSGVEGKDHYFRAMVQSEVPATYNDQIYNSAQMKKAFPWVAYAYPPPPGYAAGQPWFLAQCNEGTSSLNANDDPENNGTLEELPTLTPTYTGVH
jgi:phospholipid/cholesterol/gamma-HCH transport system substrate-binding protein